MTKPASNTAPADAVPDSWVSRAPAFARPYLQLSRYDRPAGFWLLGLPCLIGLALARSAFGFQPSDAWIALLFVVGAIAMRGAGCTYNDILDRNIDTGPIVARRRYPKPRAGIDIDRIYDPAIRADLLVQVMSDYVNNGCLVPLEQQAPEKGVNYYVIHPVLKHLAIRALEGGAQ